MVGCCNIEYSYKEDKVIFNRLMIGNDTVCHHYNYHVLRLISSSCVHVPLSRQPVNLSYSSWRCCLLRIACLSSLRRTSASCSTRAPGPACSFLRGRLLPRSRQFASKRTLDLHNDLSIRNGLAVLVFSDDLRFFIYLRDHTEIAPRSHRDRGGCNQAAPRPIGLPESIARAERPAGLLIRPARRPSAARTARHYWWTRTLAARHTRTHAHARTHARTPARTHARTHACGPGGKFQERQIERSQRWPTPCCHNYLSRN